MKCPECNAPSTGIIDSRKRPTAVVRRRVCQQCSARFTTTEVYSGRIYADLDALNERLELAAAHARRISQGRLVETDKQLRPRLSK